MDELKAPPVEILIAEDSPTQAEKLRFLLEQQGHVVRAAPNGRLALDALRERRASLVVTDVVMPMMDGYELCAAIKSDPALSDIPVVIVTSLTGIQDIAKSLECGADNFIRKPYEPKALLARIEYILLNHELRKSSRVKMGMEILMGGRKHFIASGREQIVDLLISTYEEAVNMNEELQAQQREIALSNRTLRMLYRVAGALNRVSTETAACEEALESLLELPDFLCGWVWLDDGRGELRNVATRALPDAMVGAAAFDGDCRCRRLLRGGELAEHAVVVECDRLARAGSGCVASAHASVPLAAGAQRLGIMNIVRVDGTPFSDEDLRLLEAVGSQTAIAIQRAQLYQHLEALVAQRTAALQAEVVERTQAEKKVASLNRIYAVLSGINTAIVRIRERGELFREACRVAVELGEFRQAWIGMLDADGPALRTRASVNGWPDGHGVIDDELARAARAVLDLGAHARPGPLRPARNGGGEGPCRSMAMFPLFEDRRLVGVLALCAADEGVFEDAMELSLLEELANDISFALEYIAKEERLDYLAYYDALTGLPNRALFHDRLSQLLQARDGGERVRGGLVAVLLVNIERFKSINDTLGRHAGDALLKLVGERLVCAFGRPDRLARVGSDHFAVVVGDLDTAADVAHLLDRALAGPLCEPFPVQGSELHLTFRVGVALCPGDGSDAETLFINAETALRKAGGTDGRYLFYAPQMNARVSEQLSLENRLHRALERDEFVVHYQPKIALADGRVVGFEALIRWNDPELGLISPAAFIPVLEETGLIVEAGRWVLRQALADVVAWRAAGLDVPRVAVNVSAVQLRRKDSVAELEDAFATAPDARGLLDLELTESMLMEDVDANIRKLHAIRELGVRVAVDDFGTGYSSLSYLTRFPIDQLKIDQSFVRNVTTDRGAAAICLAVIGLGHNLGLKVVAEGIERADQMSYLRRHHCDEAQGFLFSRALPADECAALLAAGGTFVLPADVPERFGT